MRKIVLVKISVAAVLSSSAEEEAACWSAWEAAGQSVLWRQAGRGEGGRGRGRGGGGGGGGPSSLRQNSQQQDVTMTRAGADEPLPAAWPQPGVWGPAWRSHTSGTWPPPRRAASPGSSSSGRKADIVTPQIKRNRVVVRVSLLYKYLLISSQFSPRQLEF